MHTRLVQDESAGWQHDAGTQTARIRHARARCAQGQRERVDGSRRDCADIFCVAGHRYEYAHVTGFNDGVVDLGQTQTLWKLAAAQKYVRCMLSAPREACCTRSHARSGAKA